MGFFNRLFKKIEDVNKGEANVAELEDEFYLESEIEEANDFWVEMAQNIIVNVVKAANNEVERAFILINMGEQPSFDVFYQVDGSLIMWHQLEDSIIKEKIHRELLPQAPDVASAVNDKFVQANHPKISYAELQFEWETKAWFSHVIWDDDENANLAKEEILSKWFNTLSEEIKTQPLDSDSKLSWYP
ncbi:hypothetical protein [Metabacillus fastidiosus]|uniref:hypothetical protein n=1 Tax=Metabacillus fastidiosus TaxID=1458 RepID=UPI002DBA2D54|nr:hypothetical protein [Metabacillus fastidiosus]MEC2074833.1 hypothetical protein [Metabacillus fastidiosus]